MVLLASLTPTAGTLVALSEKCRKMLRSARLHTN